MLELGGFGAAGQAIGPDYVIRVCTYVHVSLQSVDHQDDTSESEIRRNSSSSIVENGHQPGPGREHG